MKTTENNIIIHEAGHAFILDYMNKEWHVNMKPSEIDKYDKNGFINGAYVSSYDISKLSFDDDLIVRTAGFISELLITNDYNNAIINGCSDLIMTTRYIKEYLNFNIETRAFNSYITYIMNTTYAIIKHNIENVNIIANAIMNDDKLTSEEFHSKYAIIKHYVNNYEYYAHDGMISFPTSYVKNQIKRNGLDF